jgi:hypothetical protein
MPAHNPEPTLSKKEFMRLKCKFHWPNPRVMVWIAWIVSSSAGLVHAASQDFSWPPITRGQRPWAYTWWMASAVDPTNITRELTRYQKAGMGGVHIIPIYGAKGWESNYISYLSPRWMEMLRYTVSEADRLDLGVDMTTGTGWCFGGPRVTPDEANASVVVKQFQVEDGAKLDETIDPKGTQALMAFGPDGARVDLLPKLTSEGKVDWTAQGGSWRVFTVSQKPSGQQVKRSAPGGEGPMLNLFYPQAMTNYLRWFDEAFANYSGPKPRAQYHDSYEYKSDWAPDFFAQFERRRGYRLQDELPALFGQIENDRAGRVKCDYRETISELMSDVTLPMWVKWSHDHGYLTRNEAHGSPGNLLDLYAVADGPETEMFHLDRDKLVSKFASSAAHVAGRSFTSSETGTWLEEHFTETLADMKFLLDDLYLSGVNHIFYHGTCYSPDEAGWPGWVFYASFEMNPRNSVWHDVSALNAYAARCQAVLQAGQPDNDVLVYWPIYDRWSSPAGTVQPFTVHARDWLEQQPIGKTAAWLWNHGYQFDYISDKQLATAHVTGKRVGVAGGSYGTIVVPKCEFMPLETLQQLIALAKSGATVIFQDQLPKDVPGLADLEKRRTQFKALLAEMDSLKENVLVGDLQGGLTRAHIRPESMFDQPGLMCIRRAFSDGRYYFIANRGDKAIDRWVPLAVDARSIVVLDPMTGKSGIGTTRTVKSGGSEVYLQLAPSESIVLRALESRHITGPAWKYWDTAGAPRTLTGKWEVKFIEGGPELPGPFSTERLASWTELGDASAQRFAGTALYTLTFDAPTNSAKDWALDLGKICQSARVRLNGNDLGTVFTPPFRINVDNLKRRGNVLEIEVTNVSANRIRDLDQRHVNWKDFRDINFVNINYRPFDASTWPLTDSGLLGPVTLTPLAAAAMK